MPSSLMLLSSLGKESGNSSTANRIHQYLLKNDFTCHVRDPNSFSTSTDLCRYIRTHKINCILGIHLYKAGNLLKDCNTPFIIIIGGTDVNKYHTDIRALDVMTDTVSRARFLVVFGESLENRVHILWPHVELNKLVHIKQAVLTKVSTFCLRKYLHSEQLVSQDVDLNDALFFVLVGGIRSVKDPLYLVNVMSNWHKEDESVYFIIVGPKLEEEYYVEFIKYIKGMAGVCYIPGLSSSDTHAVIQQAFAYVNSSKSEGMSLAILEAMHLGTPVLARSIPGNKDIIKHEKTGLLYDSPQNFIKQARRLVSSSDECDQIREAARDYVRQHHSAETEEKLYLNLIKKCAKETPLH